VATDPLDRLRLDSEPVAPDPVFAATLGQRIHAALDALVTTPTSNPERTITMATHTPQTARTHGPDSQTAAPTITTSLACDDPHGLIRWLVEVLEFTVAMIHELPGGEVAHAQLSWRTGNVFVSSRHGIWGTTGPVTLCLAADDPAEIDRLYAKARAANVEIIEELHDEDYGSHQFGVRDPEGNLWVLGTYRPPVGSNQ
jgi:uncharacterized glyoxalase superfamily protein PhnB